ncbi:hypothetical protein [Flammeovirga kamogawensis]|uniref:hypothetical protein n=1 Tax=Flammeovirga kamogawensis TaxID=373891 RepID=UPI0013154754|nr:hypothetical protein [Flammeovirga kamogawensis]
MFVRELFEANDLFILFTFVIIVIGISISIKDFFFSRHIVFQVINNQLIVNENGKDTQYDSSNIKQLYPKKVIWESKRDNRKKQLTTYMIFLLNQQGEEIKIAEDFNCQKIHTTIRIIQGIQEALSIEECVFPNHHLSSYNYVVNKYFLDNFDNLFEKGYRLNLQKRNKTINNFAGYTITDYQKFIYDGYVEVILSLKNKSSKQTALFTTIDSKINCYYVNTYTVSSILKEGQKTLEELPSNLSINRKNFHIKTEIKRFHLEGSKDKKTTIILFKETEKKNNIFYRFYAFEDGIVFQVKKYSKAKKNQLKIPYYLTRKHSKDFLPTTIHIGNHKALLNEKIASFNDETFMSITSDHKLEKYKDIIFDYDYSWYYRDLFFLITAKDKSISTIVTIAGKEPLFITNKYIQYSIVGNVHLHLLTENASSNCVLIMSNEGLFEEYNINTFDFFDQNKLSNLSFNEFPDRLIHDSYTYLKDDFSFQRQEELTNQNEPVEFFEVRYYRLEKEGYISIKKYCNTRYINISIGEKVTFDITFEDINENLNKELQNEYAAPRTYKQHVSV